MPMAVCVYDPAPLDKSGGIEPAAFVMAAKTMGRRK